MDALISSYRSLMLIAAPPDWLIIGSAAYLSLVLFQEPPYAYLIPAGPQV